jgi:HEAT repeat protein
VSNAAALALASIGPASLAVLESAARHPETAIRQNVALVLGAIETSHSTGLLLELLQDPERIVQSQAIESLSSHQDPRAITALLELSRDRSDRRLQTLAQTALRKLNLDES